MLDRMPQGYGFLRLEGLERRTRATSTSPPPRSAAASCAPATRSAVPPAPRAAASATGRWSGSSSVNGQEPEGERVQFEDLTAVAPHPPAAAGRGRAARPRRRSARAARLRPARAGPGRAALGADHAAALDRRRTLAGADARVRVLLADERPEEVTEWERALPDGRDRRRPRRPGARRPGSRRRAGDGPRQAPRREPGEDVVVIIDSLSRLALGYRDPVAGQAHVRRRPRALRGGQRLADRDRDGARHRRAGAGGPRRARDDRERR